jgi:PKD repeat protein
MKTERTVKKLVGSAIVVLLVLTSVTSLAIGDRGFTIRVETDQAYYYPGEQVIVTIQLLKNGNGYPGGICPEIWDPYENMIYGGECYESDSHGYHNITNFYLDTGAPLGTYTVSVHAYADDWEGTTNTTFEVVSETITAEAHGPYQGKVGQSIQFSGDVSGGKPPFAWYWQFGDGDVSHVRNATHTYLSGGTFNALLTVTDDGGRNDDDPAVVIIQDLFYNLTVETDEPFYFTEQNVLISGALTQGGVEVPGEISLNITDPDQVLVVTEAVPTDVHGTYEYVFHLETNAVVGEYTVLVKENQYHVANATTFDVFSSTIIVDAHGPYEGNVGRDIQFSGDATGGLFPYSWFWDFGDHTNATIQNPTHSYQAPDQYNVTLTVNDSYHHVGVGTTIATITKEAPENHTVLIEEGTATWCKNCPTVAKILHELYQSGHYDFYYIAMVKDENLKASDRLVNDYNILGYPTVYIDGGYEVIYGENHPISVFEDAIRAASSRVVPALDVNLTTHWNQNTNTVETSVSVHNRGNTSYQGRLRVYLTEINSRWSDYNGKPYHFGFLDYMVNEEVSIPTDGQITRSNVTDATGLYPTNLMVIAGVFNSTKHQGYSNPPSGNPFDAYYTDATVGKRVAEGNLPPEVGITNPKSGRLHILGKPIVATKNLKTILLGRTNITASATDDSNVTKVEFYIDDTLVATFTAQPFEWMWKKPSWFRMKHTIKVIAYDDEGKTSTATMDVSAFILL